MASGVNVPCPPPQYKTPTNPRNKTQLATGQVPNVSSIPQQLNYVNDKRAATKITNLGSTDVFYGASQSVTSQTGDLIPGGRGNWVSVPAPSLIFVVTAPGITGAVSWADVYE